MPELHDARPPTRPDDDGRLATVKRPEPPVTVGERALAWWRWFGPARLAATVVSVLVVGLLGFWLVRAPVPAAEATLPVAGATTLPTVTLPPPTTVPDPTVTPSGGVGSGVADPVGDVAVVVHVAGAVADPGLHVLDGGARVDDAIESAGGPSVDADLDAVNLAQVLVDGQRLFVPTIGSVDHGSTPVLSPPVDGSGSADADDGTSEPIGPIDLNRASAAELERLPGVGPATAAAIVDDRARNGPFVTVDDLERVPGVGPAKLAALRDLVSV